MAIDPLSIFTEGLLGSTQVSVVYVPVESSSVTVTTKIPITKVLSSNPCVAVLPRTFVTKVVSDKTVRIKDVK